MLTGTMHPWLHLRSALAPAHAIADVRERVRSCRDDQQRGAELQGQQHTSVLLNPTDASEATMSADPI
jgi:hypothetical protein